MKIEFTDDRIKEFSQGMNFHLKNTGKPIDVSTANAADLLNAKVPPQDNPAAPVSEWVNVFRLVGDAPKKAADKKVMESTYPEGFPHAEILAKAGFAFEDARLLQKEQLIEIDGIGAKSADAILKFGKE